MPRVNQAIPDFHLPDFLMLVLEVGFKLQDVNTGSERRHERLQK
jgi:hypothetical protein